MQRKKWRVREEKRFLGFLWNPLVSGGTSLGLEIGSFNRALRPPTDLHPTPGEGGPSRWGIYGQDTGHPTPNLLLPGLEESLSVLKAPVPLYLISPTTCLNLESFRRDPPSHHSSLLAPPPLILWLWR